MRVWESLPQLRGSLHSHESETRRDLPGRNPHWSEEETRQAQGKPRLRQKEVNEVILKKESVSKKTEVFLKKLKEFLEDVELSRRPNEVYSAIDTVCSDWTASKEPFQVVSKNFKKLFQKAEKKGGSILDSEGVVFEYDGRRDLSCTTVFCIFLIFLHPHLSEKGFREVFLFLCIYRKSLNKFGPAALAALQQDQLEDQNNHDSASEAASDVGSDSIYQVDNKKTHSANLNLGKRSPGGNSVASLWTTTREEAFEFSDYNPPEVVADVAEDFYSVSIPEAVSSKEFTTLKHHSVLFGTSTSQKLNSILFTRILCNWLYTYSFSDSSVDLNQVNCASNGSLFSSLANKA